jgi:hypothetical protein
MMWVAPIAIAASKFALYRLDSSSSAADAAAPLGGGLRSPGLLIASSSLKTRRGAAAAVDETSLPGDVVGGLEVARCCAKKSELRLWRPRCGGAAPAT